MATISSDTPDDATAVVTASVGLPVEIAFRAFTDRRQLALWYWPERFETSYELDPTVGGIWRGRSEIISTGFTAVFGEVVANERLAMTWQWDDDESISKVEIGFAATTDGSTVTVTHSDNESVTARDEHRAGWTDCLTRLTGL